jgi:hypothetical protein
LANIAIGYEDRVRGGTVTASSERAGAGASHVQTFHHGQTWRTLTGVTSASLLIDLGSTYTIGGVYLGNHNLTATGTWRVRFSTVDATGLAGNAHDSGVISTGIDVDLRMAVRIFTANVSGRYLHFLLSDAAVSNLELGRVWAGPVFKPARNFSFGATRGYIDHSTVQPGGEGTQWVTRGARQPYCTFALPAVTSSEVEISGMQLIRKSGISEEVLVCLDSDATSIGQWTYLGLLEDVPAWEMNFPGRQTATFRVRQRM